MVALPKLFVHTKSMKMDFKVLLDDAWQMLLKYIKIFQGEIDHRVERYEKTLKAMNTNLKDLLKNQDVSSSLAKLLPLEASQ